MFNSLKKMFGVQEKNQIMAPVEGKVIPLSEVSDPVFSGEILGKGVAVIPSKGRIVAPAAGEVTVMFETKHAVSVTTSHGAEIIIHVGLDTVNLQGKYYTSHVEQGDKVQAGDLLLEFDIEGIKSEGYDVVTPIVICNTPQYPEMVCHTGMEVKEMDLIIDL